MEENTIIKKNNNVKLILLGVVIFILGLGGTWYCGNSKGLMEGKAQGLAEGIEQGKEEGRQELLAEQKAIEEEALQKIQEAANIYGDDEINPYSDAYQNPFAE